MKFTFISLLILLIGQLVSAVSLPRTPDVDVQSLYQSLQYNQDEQQLIDSFVKELTQITKYNGTNATQCNRCIRRLEVGHDLALLKPKLIHPVFIKWCIDNKIDDEIECRIRYGRNTVENNTYGSDFANMLYLMDPSGYDGQLYCSYIEKTCEIPATPKIDLSDKWPAKQPKHYIAPEPSNETYNVLHVSDFHIEMDYRIGSEANCSQYMCCTNHNYNKLQPPKDYNYTKNSNFTQEQLSNLSFYNGFYDDELNYHKDQTPVENILSNTSIWQPATEFGSYLCDAPEVLINSSLKSIVQYQEELGLNFNFSIFTGDLVDHDEQAYIGFEKAAKSEELIFRDMKSTLKDLPVYPVLGNHDTYPYAQLAQEKSGFKNLMDWNAKLMGEMWQDYGWLNESTAKYAKEHYTGYSVTTTQNLKVIALNSNAYYLSNLYNYWNATDIDSFGQFQFLIDELVASEAIDQRVWIIAHIPLVQEALPVPAEVFKQIIQRFSPYTIAGIFFGHTHLDQFNVLYDGEVSNKTEENAQNIAWISQAVTPLTENNPSWRYYSVDTKTHSIMNSYNYYFKLNDTFVNDSEEPIWEFEYSAREAYNVVNWPDESPLNATFWHKVANKVNSSTEIAQTYNNYKKRFSPYVPDCANSKGCDGSYCFLASFTYKDYRACMEYYSEPSASL